MERIIVTDNQVEIISKLASLIEKTERDCRSVSLVAGELNSIFPKILYSINLNVDTVSHIRV